MSKNKILGFSLVLAGLLTACHKSSRTTTYMNLATITGPNVMVPECGAAYRITIHGISDSMAEFNTLPTGSGINLVTATFPINVKINWHHNSGTFCDTTVNIITVDEIDTVF